MQYTAAQLLDGGPSMQVERVPLQEVPVSTWHLLYSLFWNVILNSGNSRKEVSISLFCPSVCRSCVLRMSATQGHPHTRPLSFSAMHEEQFTASATCSDITMRAARPSLFVTCLEGTCCPFHPRNYKTYFDKIWYCGIHTRMESSPSSEASSRSAIQEIPNILRNPKVAGIA
jgi:hypothetical protein